MQDKIKFGIGFITGRSNVCDVINSYYKDILNQVKDIEKQIEITIFILYDLNYQLTEREAFYKLKEDVYKDLKIRYITPENIQEEKKKLIARKGIKEKELNLFFGYGHAKTRNTLLYFALKSKIDYLLFWDDDEYPVACIKEKDGIVWKEQQNIKKHIENIENADVTIGHHCGYISPIPCLDIGKDIAEKDFKDYIEAVSNDIVTWDSIKDKMQKNNGISYANEEILNNDVKYEIKKNGAGKWVAGSTLCLNLKNIKNIPAFYVPPNARGEDTFFSTRLENSTVVRIPVYHFHDGFLKYKRIMKKDFPEKLRKIKFDDNTIRERFINVSLGWIRYKPLLLYLTDSKKYCEEIEGTKQKLHSSIESFNKYFKCEDFNLLLTELDIYSNNVNLHYKEYIDTNKVWDKIKEGFSE